MAVAECVAREIMGCCTQRHLLACRRSLPLEPMRSTRKTDLINDLVALCECPSRRRSICSHLLASWQVQELRLLIARLRALRCMVEIGPAPRKQDLVAAIISTQEYAPSRLARSKGVCPSPRPAESKGRSAHDCAPPPPREEPASSTPAGTTDSSHLSCGRGQQDAKAYVLAPHFVQQNYCGQDAKAYVLALLGCNMHL